MDPTLDYNFVEGLLAADPRSHEQHNQAGAVYRRPSAIVNDIDNIYAQIHRSIDEAFGTIFTYNPLEGDKVRQNNQTVVDKLVSYEHEVHLRIAFGASEDSMDTSAPASTGGDYDMLLDQRSSSDVSLASHRGVSRSTARQNSANFNTDATRRCRGTGYETPPQSTSHSQVDSVAPSRRRQTERANAPLTPATTVASGRPDPPDTTVATGDATGRKQRRSHSFAEKFWQIASPEAEERVREFAERHHMAHDASSSKPECFQFLATTQITDGSKFLRMLPCLAFAIESNTFEELKHRVQKRTALAHFYHAYTLAQQNPETFLAWCDEQPFRRSMLPSGGYKSIVLQRFADLMFPSSGGSSLSKRSASSKHRIGRIQTWRKIGKPWAKIIKQFGYGILLLVPPSLTDEDVRLAVDDELAHILRLAEARKHQFAVPLQQAEELIRRHVFVQESSSSEWPDMTTSTDVDWNTFLQSPHTSN